MGAVVNIILNFAFIPIFGVSGAAFATFCGYFPYMRLEQYIPENI